MCFSFISFFLLISSHFSFSFAYFLSLPFSPSLAPLFFPFFLSLFLLLSFSPLIFGAPLRPPGCKRTLCTPQDTPLKCSLDIEQYVEFEISVLIFPSKSLISSHWVTNSWAMKVNRVSKIWVRMFTTAKYIHLLQFKISSLVKMGSNFECQYIRNSYQGKTV